MTSWLLIERGLYERYFEYPSFVIDIVNTNWRRLAVGGFLNHKSVIVPSKTSAAMNTVSANVGCG